MKGLFLSAVALVAFVAVAQPPQTRTRLDLASQPSGATVLVDGADHGVTPATIFNLSPGRHMVKLSFAGYEDLYRAVVVDDGSPVAVNNVLEPEKGILLVKSTPDGCEIVIDGYSMGMTPRLITNLNAKDSHRMTLSKTGYRSSTFDLRFDGRQPLVRDETLILDSGVIRVETTPQGAGVVLNGVPRGRTPVTVENVPKGNAVLQLSMNGYKDVVVSGIVVNAGDNQTISRVLEAVPGALILSSIPAKARFYINNEFRGEDPLVLKQLEPGEYDVRAEYPGYAPLTKTVSIGKGTSAVEEFRLSNAMGRLEVRTSPAGAQVFLDGKSFGTTTTYDRDAEFSDVLFIEDVMEGEHTLLVRKDGFAEQVRHPKIRSKKTSRAKVRLKRIFKPDIEIVTDTGTHLGMLVANTPDYIIVEVSLGVQRSFLRADVRSVRFIFDDVKK